MQHDTYASRLRYLDADDVDDSVVDFDGLSVRGNDGEKLGELDGFVVDPASRRVLYLVVDSGGWFTSRRFLLPVQHATIDRDARTLRVDVSRARLRGYPEFDEDRFANFSDDEYREYDGRLGSTWTTSAAHPQEPRDPDWWPARGYGDQQLRPISSGSFRSRTSTAAVPVAPAAGPAPAQRHDRELVTAHGRDEVEMPRRSSDDVSPHFGGRAQPGDVLGIETGGETTSIGDTADEEDKRRRDAERTRK